MRWLALGMVGLLVAVIAVVFAVDSRQSGGFYE